MYRRLTRVIPTLAAILVALAATLLGAPARAYAQAESRIFISNASITEGDSGSISMAFSVTLLPASAETVTVDFATADGSAVDSADYLETTGTLRFLPTQTSKTILVPINGDTLNELNENFALNLSNPTNATLENTAATGTIQDDDPLPEITIDDVSVPEGSGGSNSAVFTVRLTTASGQTVTVDYTTSEDTATAGSDYTTSEGKLTFTPGTTTQTITVPIITDDADEPNERFTVTLSNPEKAVITDDTGIGRIRDDDGLPALSIDDASIVEGDSGTQNLVFTIRLEPASGRNVRVDFATDDDTASAGSDYTAVGPTTIRFAPGATSKTVSVPVRGDLTDETVETFFGNLSAEVNAIIDDDQGVGTIIDNDGPQISINDVTLDEGDSGTTDFVFTVSLSDTSSEEVSVRVSTVSNSATAPGDYTALNSFEVSIDPNDLSETFTVEVVADSIDEPDETFFVNLSSPINGSIMDGQGVGTITNDDSEPTISIGDANVTEGDSGTASAVFSVELSQVSGRLVTVNVATADGTAEAPGDYTALQTKTLFFPPGTRTQNVTVAVKGDTTDEDNETFSVGLTSPTNTHFSSPTELGQGVITDDDAPPTVSINDVSVTEGNSGTANATLTISLVAISGKPIDVNYASSDNTATTAPAAPLPVDYNACAGTVSFPPGVQTRTINCQVRGDSTDEFDESFFVDLSVAPAFAGVVTIADGHGIVTIQDDDAAPTVSISDTIVNEADITTGAAFTVDLSAPSGKPISVQFASSNGSATVPADYISCAGTLNIPAGTDSQTITNCDVVGDLLDEGDETFFIDLSAPTNVTIADGRGQATIIDNDPLPSISIGDATVTEGNSGTINAVFSITLSAPSGREVRVSYATANGSATAGSDYTAVATTELLFEPGVSTRNVSVAVLGDLTDEPDETFVVNLSSPQNATMADGQGEATINDDDPPPDMAISCPTVTEGTGGTSSLSCTVSLSRASARPISVNAATTDGSAESPGDYQGTSVALSFTPGEASKTISVPVVADTDDEADETFSVNLSGAVNATITTGSATATIDDDDGPEISVSDASVTEGNSGTTAISFAVSISDPSPQVIAVSYSSSDGSATSPADYSICSGTLNIAANTTAATISCLVAGDTLDEGDETFTIELSSPVDASIGAGTATGTIIDNDPQPSISINDLIIGEPTSGTSTIIFTVSLSAPSGRTVTVGYKTTDGTAAAPSDYEALAPTTLSFAPGETSQPIEVTIVGDTLNELTETFSIDLSSPTNASIADDSGTGTIIDSADKPVLNVANAAISEGNSGTNSIDFTVSLSAPSSLPISIQFSATDGSAISPEDYAACSGTLNIAAGASSAIATCTVKGDLLNESDESFTLELSSPTNAIIGDGTAIGTILNDDPLPAISFTCGGVLEPQAGATNASCTVQLSAVSGREVSVSYTTLNGSATAGSDYLTTSGALIFPPGTTEHTFTVSVLADDQSEPSETIGVRLSNPINATLAVTNREITIQESGPVPATFRVFLPLVIL